MANKGFEVGPLSSKEIKNNANHTRALALELGCISPSGFLDVPKLIEHGDFSVQIYDGSIVTLVLNVVEDRELPDAEAKTFPDGSIAVKESVYNRACDRDGRSRFTLAHELFHALCHCKQLGFCRSSNILTPCYKDSEWQANTFAGNLLLPDDLIRLYRNHPDHIVTSLLGVSNSCLQVRKQQVYKQ